MHLPEQKVLEIEIARAAVFRAALDVPIDRLVWNPMGTGQSVLGIARELAQTPDWAYWVLTEARPEDPFAVAKSQRNEKESWRTVEDCQTACLAKIKRLFDLYRSLADEDLIRTKWLPFNGGRDHTLADLLDYPRWNFTYHLGQIEYIRSLEDTKRVTCIFPRLGR